MVHISPSGKDKLDRILARAADEKKIHGLSCIVTSRNEQIYSGAAGYNALNDPSHGKVDEESVFWICSLTKLVVSIAALKLVEQGKISLDTPVATIIPELANPVIVDDITSNNSSYRFAENPITFAHLLNHSSGLFYDFPLDPEVMRYTLPVTYTYPYQMSDSGSKFYDILKRGFPGVPLQFEPGTNYSYGYSADIIGFIIEKIIGQTLEQYCKEHIFTPLGMETTFHRTPEMKGRSVELVFRDPNGTLVPLTDQTSLCPLDGEKVHFQYGGLGLHSTFKDYINLLRHLLQALTSSADKRILSLEYVQKLFQPTLTKEGVASLLLYTGGIGAQWSTAHCLTVEDWPGNRKEGSGYWFGWAGTYYFIDPTTGIAAVYGTQLIPTRDEEIMKVWAELEEALYSSLEG